MRKLIILLICLAFAAGLFTSCAGKEPVSGGRSVKLDDEIFQKARVSKGDYQLTKGVRGEQKIPVGKIQGFRKFDKVRYYGSEYFIKGRMNSGYAVLMDVFGSKADFSYLPKGQKTPKLTNLKRLTARSGCLCTREKITQSTA